VSQGFLHRIRLLEDTVVINSTVLGKEHCHDIIAEFFIFGTKMMTCSNGLGGLIHCG
jgi:hypothetical protein